MKTAIIIPARYGSTRLPGKPLKEFAGKTLLGHVYDHAVMAAAGMQSVEIAVATDDERISDYCEQNGMPFMMTDESCSTGTDRVKQAVDRLGRDYDFVINLQGDAPFCYPDFIRSVMEAYEKDPNADIITPVTQLSWDELDELREHKKQTPFSGTTTVMDENGYCRWFSKNIIPAIRKEEHLRKAMEKSPVYRHIGLYGYRLDALNTFVESAPSLYEELEGLEQLRTLENGLKIRGVLVDYNGRPSMSGVDSPEDLERAEKLWKPV